MYIPDPSPAALASHLRKTTGPDEGAVVFLGDAHKDEFSEWARLGSETECPVVVGLFPGVIDGARWHREGAVVLSVPVQGRPQVLDLTRPVPDPIEGRTAVSESSFLVLVDGLSEHVGKALSWLRDRCGTKRICVGGGAGRRSMTPGPCLIANETRLQDTAVVIPLAGQVDLGVRHGWTRTGTSLVATRTDGAVIEHLNWEPAAEAYAQAVEAHQGAPVVPDAFDEVAARHPFGLLREGREDIVRDPIARTDDGGIRCAGPVPENAVLHVLEGNADALIDAAGKVGAKEDSPESTPDTVFVADCVSRQFYLDDRMNEELEAIAAGGRCNDPPPYGVLSIGEIACDGTGRLEWLNKTTVQALLSTSSETFLEGRD
jgi:hypothetical protein